MLEEKLARVRQLIAARDEIDAELSTLFSGVSESTTKNRKCKTCGQEGHRADKCPSNKNGEAEAPPVA